MTDYSIRVQNTRSGHSVDITGDHPIEKFIYWSIRTTLCPEAYINLNIPPGKQLRWTYRYQFAD